MSEQSENVIASFDPGGTTGWALMRGDDITFGVFEGDMHHVQIWDFLTRQRPTRVIYEKFNYQRRQLEKGVQLNIDARNYIGVIELWCMLYKVQMYPSELAYKKFWDDKKLKTVGLYSGVTHQRDAVRHLLYWVTFKWKDQEWVRRLAQ